MHQTLRFANGLDGPRIEAFYASFGTTWPDRTATEVLLGESDGEIVGAVCLCREDGFLVLRGMLVREQFRGAGLGRRMLLALVDRMEDACYCLPYSHLEPFYGSIGFVPVPAAEAPAFLRDRFEQYSQSGDEFSIMKRLPKPSSDR